MQVTNYNHLGEIEKSSTAFCDIVVAADGAHSLVRKQCSSRALSPEKSFLDSVESTTRLKALEEEEQHLIHIHFITSPIMANYLRSHFDDGCPGILHFVYNNQVVCTFVVHDIEMRNSVCQIPYFPTLQTIHVDVTHGKYLRLSQSWVRYLSSRR